jgi:hypothetical protein
MMQELEKRAYIFSVEAIGLAMSMEKEGTQKELAGRLKEASGKVYTLLTDALGADENKDFADLFRESHRRAKEALECLNESGLQDEALNNKKAELTSMAEDIIERMNTILGKIIY